VSNRSEHELSEQDWERLRRAAEDAAWMVARGYPSADSSAFVASHRGLSTAERSLLAKSAEIGAAVKHHIARELDPEDVARRPLRVDLASVVAVVAAALEGRLLLESPAGVLVDPAWERAGDAPVRLPEALAAVVAASSELRPKSVTWLLDAEPSSSAAYAEALAAHSKVGRAAASVERVQTVATRLEGAGFIASSDAAVLDRCGTWVNLAALSIADLPDLRRVRLHDG
jgi:hypothetical protein